MKFLMRNIGIIASIAGLFVSSACVFGAEEYVALNSAITRKCGITFNHPRFWKMFYVEPENPDEFCIIAYKNLRTKKVLSDMPMLQGWKEFADSAFYVKKIPVEERLGEFNFKLDKNGRAQYLGEGDSELPGQRRYTPTVVDGFEVIQQDNGVLYIGRAHNTRTEKSGNKMVVNKLKNIDLLFGNASFSVGDTSAESNLNNELRGYNAVYEKIYKSMRFIENSNYKN